MSVTYTWTSLSVTGTPGSLLTPTSIPVGTLTFSDAAVASGSYSMSEFMTQIAGSPPSIFVVNGDPSQVAYLPTGSQFAITSPPHQFSISVVFNPDDTLSGRFGYDDAYTGVNLNGTGQLMSGFIRADWLANCPSPMGGCAITGYFSAPAGSVANIPEPPTIFTLAAMIAAVLLAKLWPYAPRSTFDETLGEAS